MSRRSGAANGIEKEIRSEPRTTVSTTPFRKPRTKRPAAPDKQKRLLEQPDPGHFSMIRALHLADLITLGNGTSSRSHSVPTTYHPQLILFLQVSAG